MTWAVRPYVAADCAGCWHVFFDAVQTGARHHYSQAQRDAWCASVPAPTLENCARLGDALTCVAHRGETVIGFMTLERNGHLDMAFVTPDDMGRGVAGALHESVLQSARAHGLGHLTADASHLARKFLARHGWHEIEAETVMRAGVPLERFRMELKLEPTQ
ncbi:GNAT family N-acetyltransferase [Sedimentitalea todarodis]|uniref:GNAT family N-acetyltransferase n=1 Tax=Sedimentitalea todarodis TaxID=1631240 RepID=A0ABU3V8X2_9RHOB|nr:GNAT family N-acetyltransferase [Sedimentitalea todarodis]MDU9002616.1 GNAT family N-acetyltransferase [Sedimentitalea todarodis]